MTLFRRLKNLWKLSEYRLDHQREFTYGGITQLTHPKLTKDIPSQKKPATIIQEAVDLFDA